MAKKAAREMPVISATGNRGFTLLELLVVLAIMVLLAGAWPFAAPRLFPVQQLRNEGQRLVSTLRSARMMARVSGVQQTVALLETGEGYQSVMEPHQLPTGVIARIRTGDISMRSLGVMFFPDGSSTGGIIDLALPNHRVSVAVGKITGRAELIE
jgi:general secretion pathway protein H